MKRLAEIEIAGRKIGAAHEPYIICELSGNHNQDLDRALRLVDAAADTGADAIKIQTYTQDTITMDHDGPGFRIEGGLWHGRTLYDLYREAHTPYEWHGAIFERARKRGVTLFSTPFDRTAVDLLESLEAPAYKIASFEAVDLPLIAYVARTGKPMIISTGTCNLGEIAEALATARSNGCEDIVLLHCVSSYPAATEDSNVRTVPHLGQSFNCVAGLSDHTHSSAAAVASIALGGAVIEKHFTLARADGGPDAAFSLEPAEFAALTEDCKSAWRSLGSVSYELLASEKRSAEHRRSLYIVEDMNPGDVFTPENLRSIRPSKGLPPKYYDVLLGKRINKSAKRGTPTSWDLIG